MIGRSSPGPNPPEEIRGFDAFELRLGDVMRGERATLGKSLIDVQRELKIKATYIAAIENADPSAFDTPGFIAGYVRSYARYLGLDPEWAWETFCREAGFQNPHGLSAAASAPKPAKRTGLDALGDPNASFVPRRESALHQIELRAIGSVFVLVALIGAVGYGAWSVLQEVQRVQLAPSDTVPTVVPELETTGLTAPGASTLTADSFTSEASVVIADVADRPLRPAELDVPIVDPRDGPIAAVAPGSVGALADTSAEPAAEVEVAAAEPQPNEALDPPQVVAEGLPGVYIVAVRPAWVRINGADGTVLFEKTLEPGENWQVPATEVPPMLRTGNAGAIYFMVEGQTFGPVGPTGQVIDKVSLGATDVAQSFQPADAAGDPDLAVAVALLQAIQ
jgi:cytoskeletal protein RodZ